MRRFVFLVLSAILFAGACAPGEDPMLGFSCSYQLQIEQDTTLVDVVLTTMPKEVVDHYGLQKGQTPWRTAILQRSGHLSTDLKKGETLQIPARCAPGQVSTVTGKG